MKVEHADEYDLWVAGFKSSFRPAKPFVRLANNDYCQLICALPFSYSIQLLIRQHFQAFYGRTFISMRDTDTGQLKLMLPTPERTISFRIDSNSSKCSTRINHRKFVTAEAVDFTFMMGSVI
ncbi:hypothetical protein ACNKHV_04855 [Shigella flexneri]